MKKNDKKNKFILENNTLIFIGILYVLLFSIAKSVLQLAKHFSVPAFLLLFYSFFVNTFLINFGVIIDKLKKGWNARKKILFGIFVTIPFIIIGVLLFNAYLMDIVLTYNGALILGVLLQKYSDTFTIYFNVLIARLKRTFQKNGILLLYIVLSFVILISIALYCSSIGEYLKQNFDATNNKYVDDIIEICQDLLDLFLVFYVLYIVFTLDLQTGKLKNKPQDTRIKIANTKLDILFYRAKHFYFLLTTVSIKIILPQFFYFLDSNYSVTYYNYFWLNLIILMAFYMNKYKKNIFNLKNISVVITISSLFLSIILTNSSKNGQVNYIEGYAIQTWSQNMSYPQISLVKLPSGSSQKNFKMEQDNSGKKWYLINDYMIDSKYFDVPNEYSIQNIDCDIKFKKHNVRGMKQVIPDGVEVDTTYQVVERKVINGDVRYRIVNKKNPEKTWITSENMMIISERSRGDKRTL